MNSKSLLAIFYHKGALPKGGTYHRSICVDYFVYNDGAIQKIIQKKEGVKSVNHP